MHHGRRLLTPCCEAAASQTPIMPMPSLATLFPPTCSKVFIDGGSNLGESVDSWYAGTFHRCSLNQPTRLYPRSWKNASAAEKRQRMLPLQDRNSFCVRSFESNLFLMPALNVRARALQSAGRDVQFVGAMLSNTTSPGQPRHVVNFSHAATGSTATTFRFRSVHTTLPVLADDVKSIPSLDVRNVVRTIVAHDPGAVIALKLDVEGEELYLLDALTRAPSSRAPGSLICEVSYLFVEFHNLHVNLTH